MSEQRWRRGGSRERLLHAAVQAMAEQGPGGVTGRAIARDADVHHAQIQQMFGSVDILLTEAVIAERDRFVAEVFDTTDGVPDPLALADAPLFWRTVGQLLIDPGPIDMNVLRSGGPIPTLIHRLRATESGDDPTLVNTKAIAWAAAPLGALVFRDPLQRGLRIGDDDWSTCWSRMGSRLLDLCALDRLEPAHPRTLPSLSSLDATSSTPTGGRDQLIAAAEDLLSTRFESAVTGRELAAHAGVNYGLVSHHFGSKSVVFDEALLRLHQRFLDDVLDAAAHSDGLGAPDVFFRHHAFMRAWAGRLLGNRPVPEFKLLGMQRLIDELAIARSIAPTDRDSTLCAAGDALASVGLKLGWSLLEPAPLADTVDRSGDLVQRLSAVHQWLLESPT